jgi:hypothetical protein
MSRPSASACVLRGTAPPAHAKVRFKVWASCKASSDASCEGEREALFVRGRVRGSVVRVESLELELRV